MATCKLVLDKRVSLKNDEFNLSVRVIENKNQLYLNIAKMTESQYESIFNLKNFSKGAIKFREGCQEHLVRCERIISEMNSFDRNIIRDLFYNKNKKINPDNTSLMLKDLFKIYVEERPNLSVSSIMHMQHSKNVFTKDNHDRTILEVTKDFLKKLELNRRKNNVKISAINSNMRDLRTVVNYFSKRKKILPHTFENPFGGDGYIICEYFPRKEVLSNDEIKSLLAFDDFDSKEEELSRDIWELLYRFNGINFADLLRLRWDNKKGKSYVFFRKKTENTRKNHKKEITVPITDRIEFLLDKIGDKQSPFVLGTLKEGYTDVTFTNLNRKCRKIFNSNLGKISVKLQLSIPLKLKTARDSYATVLKRSNNVTIEQISEMLGHSDTKVTRHYIDSMEIESLIDVNSNLI